MNRSFFLGGIIDRIGGYVEATSYDSEEGVRRPNALMQQTLMRIVGRNSIISLGSKLTFT